MIFDLVDELDWPALYGIVRAHSERCAPHVFAAAKRAEERYSDEHEALAVMILYHPGALSIALSDAAPTLDDVEAHLLGCWLYDTAADFDRGIRYEERELPPAAANVPTSGPVLDLDERVAARLPAWLAALVRCSAERQPRRHLIVVAEPVTWSTYTLAAAGIIRLDVRLCEGLVADLVDVMVHELAHSLDPRLSERSVAGQEEFADALARRVIEERPESLDELDRLIEEVDVPAVQAPVEIRLASLVRFALARLHDTDLDAVGASPPFPGEGCPAVATVAAVKAGTQRTAAPSAIEAGVPLHQAPAP